MTSACRLLLAVVVSQSGLLGCAEGSESPNCPGVGAPTVLELSALTPALGDTVTNDAIVHSFTIVDSVAISGIALTRGSTHTAGTPEPDLTFTHDPPTATSDFVAAAVSWETAPGHVEIEAPVVYETPEGCGYRLPSPLFSYDLSAP